MLFNVILVLLVIYTMATPFFYVQAIKFGMRVWDEPDEVKEMTTFHLPKRKKEPKMTPSEQRTYQILQNIDRYDGTSNGQKEIKVNGL